MARTICCPVTDEICTRSNCSVRICALQAAEEQVVVERAKAIREYEEVHLPRETERVAKEWWPNVQPALLKKYGKKRFNAAEKYVALGKLAQHPKVIEEARKRIASRYRRA